MTLEELRAIDIEITTRVKLSDEVDAYFGFEADELILVGGALTTPERFARFHESLAHVYDDGKIRRFGRVIGDVSMVELLP